MARRAAGHAGIGGRGQPNVTGIVPPYQAHAPGSLANKKVNIKDFTGLFTNFDPSDIAVGAARQQVNVTGERPGYLQGREGVVLVKFRSG